MDVYYQESRANAASIVFIEGKDEDILAEYSAQLGSINEYIPGQFYKRELPCLLHVFRHIQERINLIIIDGFVSLEEGRKGLGAYLFEALKGNIPVIGVAKKYYHGAKEYLEVLRGKSKRPLFVSSIGVDLAKSAKLIQGLKGLGRVPDILRKTDKLTRAIAP